MQNMIDTDLSSNYDGIIISSLQNDTAAQLVRSVKMPFKVK